MVGLSSFFEEPSSGLGNLGYILGWECLWLVMFAESQVLVAKGRQWWWALMRKGVNGMSKESGCRDLYEGLQ